ncbi:MAG: hypothetical protein KDB61_12855 [Planctomycetes bacterium]|nr:hypothetical protein [Planctomycetota bacterium]
MTDQDRTDPRTVQEALLDVDYAVVLWGLHMRFWRRARALVTVFLVAGSSFAVVSWAQQDPKMASIAALLLVLFSAFNFAVSPADRQAEARERHRTYAELRSQLPVDATLEQVDAALRKAAITDPPAIESLRYIAYNDNLLSKGYPTHVVRGFYWPRALRLA